MSTYAYQRSVIEAAKFIRNFGKKVILDRQGAVLQGEDTPLDILAHILSVKEKQSTITNEDLVDDFVTFFVAGDCVYIYLHSCYSIKQVCLMKIFSIYMILFPFNVQ